jgi:hypothetical protein
MVYIFDQTSGRLLSQEHQRIAELINDYDPDLYLVWIPPEDRDTEDARDLPFAIRHCPENAAPYIARRMKESEVDERLIAWLFQNDAQRSGGDPVGRIEAEIRAKEAVKLKAQVDEMMENHELAASIMASPLNTYKHNGVKYQ